MRSEPWRLHRNDLKLRHENINLNCAPCTTPKPDELLFDDVSNISTWRVLIDIVRKVDHSIEILHRNVAVKKAHASFRMH
jgi:hypothetical protein